MKTALDWGLLAFALGSIFIVLVILRYLIPALCVRYYQWWLRRLLKQPKRRTWRP